MSAIRKLQRTSATKEEAAKLRMGKRAVVVAGRLFDGPPPSVDALKIRIAIAINLIRLAEKAQMKDLDGVLKTIRVGWVSYDAKRDGPSDYMRWWQQVLEQRALEAAWWAEETAKKRAFVKEPEEKSDDPSDSTG